MKHSFEYQIDLFPDVFIHIAMPVDKTKTRQVLTKI